MGWQESWEQVKGTRDGGFEHTAADPAGTRAVPAPKLAREQVCPPTGQAAGVRVVAGMVAGTTRRDADPTKGCRPDREPGREKSDARSGNGALRLSQHQRIKHL